VLLVADWCLQELVVGPRHSFGFVLLSFPASRKYGPMSGVFWDTFVSFTTRRTGSVRAFVSGHEHPSCLGSKSLPFKKTPDISNVGFLPPSSSLHQLFQMNIAVNGLGSKKLNVMLPSY